jgi:hypothetical protein
MKEKLRRGWGLPERGPQTRSAAVDTRRIPRTDHDDTVEAHYASLERLHACIDRYVYVGYVVESKYDLDGERGSRVLTRSLPPLSRGGAVVMANPYERF